MFILFQNISFHSEITALCFIITFTGGTIFDDLQTPDDENLTLKLRLASVCYTHSPHFLQELKSCATEFKQYMTRVASSIKHAATEMAMGLVSKR